MDCKHVKENLSAYLDRALADEEMASIKAHLDDCPECREECRALQETIHMLSSLEEIIPPASFRRELRSKLQGKAQKKRTPMKALISNWIKGLKRTQLVPAAVALVLLVVIIPIAGQTMFRGGLAKDEVAMDMVAPSPAAETPALTGEARSKMAVPQGRDMGSVGEKEAQQVSIMSGAGEAPAVGEVIERKIIKNADILLEVDDYHTVVESLKQQVEVMGGYVANESVNAMEHDGTINGFLQVRIPSVQFDTFLSGLEGLGKCKNRNVYTQDVTEEYVDVESRLKALRTKEERLLAILNKSGALSDILAVENELANTRAELESLQGRLRYLDNRTDFSLVNINIRQMTASTQQISNLRLKDVLSKTKEAFIQSINNILIGFGKLIVWSGSAFPKLVLIALAVMVLWWGLRKRRK